MEDAKITSEKEQSQQSQMYQRGRYPSVIDTDDLMFEIGRQTIENLNKEKLLDSLLVKSKTLENTIKEISKTKQTTEKRVPELEISNKAYLENNQKLDAELVKVRVELESVKVSWQKSKDLYEAKLEEKEKEIQNLKMVENRVPKNRK